MKIKTSELTGNVLCYAVTMLEMPNLIWNKTIGIHHASNQIVVPELKSPECYSPFTTWGMLGPIIERERITVSAMATASFWKASKEGAFIQSGGSPLIAAMRCYVTSKLGNEVEVPKDMT